MWKRLHVKYPLFFSNLNETWIFSTDFRKCSHIKFHQNPSSGSGVVPCGRTDGKTDGHDEANSRSSQSANAPKNIYQSQDDSISPKIHVYILLQIFKRLGEASEHEVGSKYSVFYLLTHDGTISRLQASKTRTQSSANRRNCTQLWKLLDLHVRCVELSEAFTVCYLTTRVRKSWLLIGSISVSGHLNAV